MIASISYSDLHDASQQAHKVAKRFDDYADELQRRVLSKLSNYNGPWTSNMASAYQGVSTKINELRTDCTRFETYSTDLDNLLDECKEVDDSVRDKIAKLTGDFKKANGIRNSAIENALAYTFTAIGNATAAGRFLGNVQDSISSFIDHFFQKIKDWFNFGGGKKTIANVLKNALAIAGAVITVITAVGAVTASAGAASGFVAALATAASVVASVVLDVAGWASLTNPKSGNDPFMSLRCGITFKMGDIMEVTDKFYEWLRGFLLSHRDFTEKAIEGLKTICSITSKINSFFNDTYKYFSGKDLPFYDLDSKETKEFVFNIRQWILDTFF